MEDLQIAYDLIVIMIGLAALSMAVFWAFKTVDADLQAFCILYTLFTLVLIVLVLKKYMVLNVEDYSPQTWYFLSGVEQVVSLAVLVALIHFFLGIYQVRSARTITLAFLLLMFLVDGLIFSPIGAVLDAADKSIRLGVGYKISVVWYVASFTFAMAIGCGLLGRIWNTERRNFVLGLLIFATVGYTETLFSFFASLRMSVSRLATEDDFLISSIPYAIYGIFLIVYFLRYSAPVSLTADTLSTDFLSKYGITDREREIILKVMQGKSNANIANDLVISLATVKTHLHNIYKKIGVESRFDLLARVRSDQ